MGTSGDEVVKKDEIEKFADDKNGGVKAGEVSNKVADESVDPEVAASKNIWGIPDPIGVPSKEILANDAENDEFFDGSSSRSILVSLSNDGEMPCFIFTSMTDIVVNRSILIGATEDDNLVTDILYDDLGSHLYNEDYAFVSISETISTGEKRTI